MKRIIALLLSTLIVLSCSNVLADITSDIENMTAEDLSDLITRAVYRLSSLQDTGSDRPVLYSGNDISVSIYSYTFEDKWGKGKYLNLVLLVDNNTDCEYYVNADHAVINSWTVDPGYSGETHTQPHTKNKGLFIHLPAETDAEVKALEEIKTLVIELTVMQYEPKGDSVKTGDIKLVFTPENGFVVVP